MIVKKGIFTLGVISFVLLGSFFVYNDHLRGLSGVEDLAFGYGNLLANLRATEKYQACGMSYMPANLCFSGHRLPFIAYFLWLSSVIFDNNLLLITISKNILSSLLLFKAIHYVYQKIEYKKVFILLIFFALTFPRWVLHYFQINTEESYIIPFFAFYIAYLLFNSDKHYDFILFVMSIIGLLYSKNSLLFVALVSPVFYFIRYRKSPNLFIIITVFLAGLFFLAYFNYLNAGKFTVNSSWEGWNLYKGNNPNTLAYYPEKSLDQLDYDGLIPHRLKPFQSEWEYSDFLKSKAVDFIHSHPLEFLKLIGLKAYLFFLAPFSPACCSPSGLLKIINNVYLLFYRLLFISSLGWFFYQLARKSKMNTEALQVSLLYLTVLFLFSGFYIIGFVYERHITPIVLPTVFYAVKILSISRRLDILGQ